MLKLDLVLVSGGPLSIEMVSECYVAGLLNIKEVGLYALQGLNGFCVYNI